MNKKRVFQVLVMALLTFTGAKAQSETMYVVHTVDGVTSVVEYPVSEIDSVVFTKPPKPMCPDKNHPHIIDLGLPSGTKWACCNVGASKPEEYGSHFNWGKIADENNTDYYYGTASIQGNSDYDAATANWGGSWVTPTKGQLEELKNNCNWDWTTENGINGYKVTSKKDGYTGASIFLPAAGFRSGSGVYEQGDYGYYWSSTPYENDTYVAYCLYFGCGDLYVYDSCRDNGYSVRAVCP